MIAAYLYHLLKNFPKKIKRLEKITVLIYLIFGFLFFHLAQNMLVQRPSGLYVGQVNLYGDLVFHLTLINKFLVSGKILPDNPIYAGGPINYPIVADLITALLSKIIGLNSALFLTTFLVGLISIFIAHLFIRIFIKNNKVAFISLVLFFLNGGFGFYYFFKDFIYSGNTFFQFLQSMPNQYTDIKDKGYWWINNLLAYFLPQRAFLFAFPITLLALTLLYFGYKKNSLKHFLLAGILSGTLPIVQIHSLLVLFFLSLFYFPMNLVARKKYWKKIILNWISFAAITGILAIPLFLSISTFGNSVSNIKFHFGWVSKENIFWFWLKNMGLFGPLLILSLIWFYFKNRFLFNLYLPFLAIFIICNLFIFQPWDFDNGKLLIYWYFASCILVGSFLYEQFFLDSNAKKILGTFLVFLLIFASCLDVLRTFTPVTYYQIFSNNDLEVAQSVGEVSSKDAVFLTAQNHNNPIPALSGHSTFIGYPGWLWSHGINFQNRQTQANEIYAGDENASLLIKKYRINFVTVGPTERQSFPINYSFLVKYPKIQITNDWAIYDVSSLWSHSNGQN